MTDSRHTRIRSTARDVAQALGISQSTVSRAFTEDASVSPQTRAAILRMAGSMGYKPNALARSLITNRSKIVGLVSGSGGNPFYADALQRFSQHLQQQGYQTLLFTAPAGHDVDALLPVVLQYQVDAVIVLSAPLSAAMAEACERANTPVILFNRALSGAKAHTVACDNVGGAALVADWFAALDCCRPAFVTGRDDTSTNRERLQGFTSRLRERGMPLWRVVAGGDFTYEAGYRAMQTLLATPGDAPDAIFFANDIMALGGIDALKLDQETTSTGRQRRPAIVGFDGIAIGGWASYQLSTIVQPLEEMVAAAVRIVTDPPPEGQLVEAKLPGKVLVRASAPAPVLAPASTPAPAPAPAPASPEQLARAAVL